MRHETSIVELRSHRIIAVETATIAISTMSGGSIELRLSVPESLTDQASVEL